MSAFLHKLLHQVMQSNSPVGAAEALIRENPQLPALAGKAWADGFNTDKIPQDIARCLVEHGAALSVHAAAGLGLVDRLEKQLTDEPELVHAKGGDGCTPLHFARDVATAQLLVERGAHLDARDDDHDSTPAQWRIGSAPEVARFLLERGAAPDVFLAAALGDLGLARELIARDPGCAGQRIGRLSALPPIGHLGLGGTILQWTPGFNSYPHQIALRKGHTDVFEALYEASDTQTRLLVCCVLGRREEAFAIVRDYPDMVAGLPDADLELLPRYCWETNLDYEAVRLMLDLGFPVAKTERSHGYTPLHNAAWAGDLKLVDLLIERGHPVELVDPTYSATALGWAIHDCVREKRHPEGNFAGVAESLLKEGSPWNRSDYPTGDGALDEVLARYL